jgi:predicted ATP-grasp superfamily ATP-dependent carboligase
MIAMRVLITNAEDHSMLATCRSLGAAGYEVGAVAFTPFASSHASRSCSERLRMTDPAVDAERFIDELREQLTRQRYELLVPGSDRAILAISAAREQLECRTRIGLPDKHAVKRSLDRARLADTAAEVGLIPAGSIRCDEPDEVLVAAGELGFPVIVKSAAAVDRFGQSIRQAFPTRSFEGEDALAAADLDQPGPLLVQRFERGEVVSFAGVMTADGLLATVVARYWRTWPVRAGNAAFAETIAPPAQLREAVPELLERIGWEGVFELELIRTEDGRFVPIDLNPRPYGSLSLAGAAGAPLAAIWCDWLLGREPRAAEAEAGHRYRWEDGDLRHLAWQLRRGNYRAALAAAQPRRHVTHAYFQRADPLPLLMRSAHQARAASSRLSGRRAPAPARHRAR